MSRRSRNLKLKNNLHQRFSALTFGRTLFQARGFSLIELMITLIIISTILIYTITAYEEHLIAAKVTRARTDIEEICKAVRWYNIREEKPFAIGTFTPLYLGTFIGNFLEKAPPFDPWGKPYRHNPDLGIVFSTGPDFVEFGSRPGAPDDDVVMHYLPEDFCITRAAYIDSNQNNQVDFGDEVEITLARPAQMANVNVFDFKTLNPESAFGSAKVVAPQKGSTLRLVFTPPVAPKIKLGETKLLPFYDIQSIKDFSHPPKTLGSVEEVVINRRRM